MIIKTENLKREFIVGSEKVEASTFSLPTINSLLRFSVLIIIKI